MNNSVVKWILVIIVIGIWFNMIRVSVPAILEYFNTTHYSTQENGENNIESLQQRDTRYRDVVSLRNPFSRLGGEEDKKVKNTKQTTYHTKQEKSVFSQFNLKGVLVIDNEKIAILEGREEIGITGVFYAKVGDVVMGEKIIEIGENYAIIFKEGEKIMIYEVR